MSDVTVRLAETEADFEAARALGRRWVDWLIETYPELREGIEKKFDAVVYAQILRDLPVIHARPKGAVLLAWLDGRAVGCVMYVEKEPGLAEFFRFFVDTPGRGRGIGRLLLETMFAHMAADGYDTVCFSSAKFLTHAKALYEALGFSEVPPPPGAEDVEYFMARPLPRA